MDELRLLNRFFLGMAGKTEVAPLFQKGIFIFRSMGIMAAVTLSFLNRRMDTGLLELLFLLFMALVAEGRPGFFQEVFVPRRVGIMATDAVSSFYGGMLEGSIELRLEVGMAENAELYTFCLHLCLGRAHFDVDDKGEKADDPYDQTNSENTIFLMMSHRSCLTISHAMRCALYRLPVLLLVACNTLTLGEGGMSDFVEQSFLVRNMGFVTSQTLALLDRVSAMGFHKLLICQIMAV